MDGIYIAIIVVVVLIVAVILMGGRSNETEKKEISNKMVEYEKLSRGDEAARRDAVVRMDTLLGRAFKCAGVRGETVGEQLKNAKNLFDRRAYDNLWKAHKLRNTLVHEDVNASSREVQDAVKSFKSSISRLIK